MEIKLDKFNSEIFGIQMGNLLLSDDDLKGEPPVVSDVIQSAKKAGFEHLSVKVPTPQKVFFNSLVRGGFFLTDTLLEFVYKFGRKALPAIEHKAVLRDYEAGDIDGLMAIAKGAFNYDRYHSDPFLDDVLCDKYYEQWIYNSCHGFADKVITAVFHDEIVGFTTGKADHTQEFGRLVLSAVSGKYQGLGIYTSMIYEGVKWLQSEGFKGLLVGTQINNIAVQKAWIKLGFTAWDSEYVLHMKL